jgi:hypothetical protein
MSNINNPHLPASNPAGSAASSSMSGMRPEDGMLQAQQEQLQMLLREQQQHQQQQQPLHFQQPPAGLDLHQLGAILQAQNEAGRANQLATMSQMLAVQAMGPLRSFSGKGATTGTQTEEWCRAAERWFEARESIIAPGSAATAHDAARVNLAVNALSDDAVQWWDGLPQAARPTTWAEFRKKLLERYGGAATAEGMRWDKLCAFAAAGAKNRDKLNLEGLQAFLSRFQQLANEVPDWMATAHMKIGLLGRALPAKVAEPVWTEHRKNPTRETLSPLHEIAAKVLNKAYFKEYSSSHSSGAAAGAAASPMDLDAINLCAVQFGVSQEEAARYLSNSEGWAPHETDGEVAGPAGRSAAAAAPAAKAQPAAESALVERLLAAFETRFANRGAPRGPSQRRMVPGDVAREVPEALAEDRKKAGLCIKCGVAKYEPGGKGHNSRTCKAQVDKTTSAAEGRKKAAKDF